LGTRTGLASGRRRIAGSGAPDVEVGYPAADVDGDGATRHQHLAQPVTAALDARLHA
jgi:hypothetical protein